MISDKIDVEIKSNIFVYKVDGWKSYDLVDFVSFKLRAATPDEILKTSGSDSATGKGTAEIQSCAG